MNEFPVELLFLWAEAPQPRLVEIKDVKVENLVGVKDFFESNLLLVFIKSTVQRSHQSLNAVSKKIPRDEN